MKKTKSETILKAALVVAMVLLIIQSAMLVRVQADQDTSIDFRSLHITAEDMNHLGEQMSPDIKAQVNAQAPSCTPSVYLGLYCEYDPGFEDVIVKYFGLEEEAR